MNAARSYLFCGLCLPLLPVLLSGEMQRASNHVRSNEICPLDKPFSVRFSVSR
jgi:hypothetical protein